MHSSTTKRTILGVAIALTGAGVAEACDCSDLAAADFVLSPGDSIEAAISSAASGDVIELTPGVYSANHVSFQGKSITLRSTCPCDPEVVAATVLDGGAEEGTILVLNSWEWTGTAIEGLTFRNGTGQQASSYRHGGAIYINGASAEIRHCHFEDNTASLGGAISAQTAWVYISECEFRGNQASGASWRGGGAIGTSGGATLNVANCRFHGNTSSNSGGAISVAGSFDPVHVSNCVFAGNTASRGGALRVHNADLQLGNSTIADNNALDTGGAIHLLTGTGEHSADIRNSILWNNSAPLFAEIHQLGDMTTTVNNSTIFSLGFEGEGNDSFDPQFVNAADGDYRLGDQSPALNAGSNADVPADLLDVDGDGDTTEPLPYDVDGNVRVASDAPGNDIVVDRGAYERQAGDPLPTCHGDLTNDGFIDFADLLELILSWGTCSGDCDADLDGSGLVDMQDLIDLLDLWGTCA